MYKGLNTDILESEIIGENIAGKKISGGDKIPIVCLKSDKIILI